MISKLSFTIAIVLAGAVSTGPAFAQSKAAPPGATVPPPAKLAPAPLINGVPMLKHDVLALTDLTLANAAKAASLLDAMPVDAVHAVKDALLATEPGFTYQPAQSAEERAKAREAAAKQRDVAREDRIYEEGYRHVSEGRYDRAIERFNDVLTMKGTRTDAALYWKAHAQDRLGQRAEALATITTLTRDHASSRYLKQARALEAEIRRNAGQPVRPQDQADEELKLMAIAALQHQAPDQAVPMLEKIINGTASPKLKERALFVLAQSNTARSREVLIGVAKGNSTPELQSRAISYLGTHGGRESRALLSEVYSGTNDVDIKKRILRAFMVGGEKDRLLSAAQTEQNPELRGEAVRQLGVMGAHTELSQLYARETAVPVKKQIIQAMFVGGNATRMIELARTETNPELRTAAIRNLGMMGSKGTGDVLVEIYGSDKNVDVRKAVISALAIQDNATALVAIARKEQDPVLHKAIVSRMAHINSQVVRDYMMEILNK